ncbi:MAG: trypsin-like peptidase domain-containing protein [Pseudomonadales bacterium]|nr:trypsin-like peptidase domain-containing protein [Pseudomonadales bacterium]
MQSARPIESRIIPDGSGAAKASLPGMRADPAVYCPRFVFFGFGKPRWHLMKAVLTYILWPTLAGLALAGVLLLSPLVVRQVPLLQTWLAAQDAGALPDAGAKLSFSAPIRAAAPAVVSINYREKLARDVLRVYPRAPLGPGLPSGNIGVLDTVDEENSSLGSGVIISADGYIVTSYHVVFPGTAKNRHVREEGNSTTVTLTDGREVRGTILFLDAKHDLALLKVDETHLPYLTLSDSAKLQVGDVVLAIGNPRNIGQSVSLGIISALLRRDDSYVIQTDAAINPGNSGGALIDQSGKLIGINAFIVSESGGSEGISFSVPATEVLNLLQSYHESGGASGYLGVNSSVLPLDQGQERFGKEIQGFLIKDVTPKGSADKAGIRAGDVITGINGTPIEIADETDKEQASRAIGLISKLPPGALIEVDIFRDGQALSLPVILGGGEPQINEQVDPELVNQLNRKAD